MLDKQIKLKNGEYLDLDIQVGDCVIDCGANVGDITNIFQSMGANVIAFEPNEHAFKALQTRFASNPRVKCIQKGVSGAKSAGIKKLFLHEKADENQVVYSTGSSIVKSKSNVNKNNFVDIELINLCEFLTIFKRDVKILKIDIEGAEVELLNDLMDHNLLKNIPYVFVETHENKIPDLRIPTEKLKERIKKEHYTNVNLNWI